MLLPSLSPSSPATHGWSPPSPPSSNTMFGPPQPPPPPPPPPTPSTLPVSLHFILKTGKPWPFSSSPIEIHFLPLLLPPTDREVESFPSPPTSATTLPTSSAFAPNIDVDEELGVERSGFCGGEECMGADGGTWGSGGAPVVLGCGRFSGDIMALLQSGGEQEGDGGCWDPGMVPAQYVSMFAMEETPVSVPACYLSGVKLSATPLALSRRSNECSVERQ